MKSKFIAYILTIFLIQAFTYEQNLGQSMRIILLGAPGSGKGTQAEYLVKKFNIPKISTGDILRAAVASGSALGIKVKADMEAGKLVEDDIILELVKDRIKQSDCARGFLFDGFPRTLAQAKALLQAGVDVNYVIDIQVTDDEIMQRLTGRWVHPTSGRTYHAVFNPPKESRKDDLTGEPLVQRHDDKEHVVKQRLIIYHQQTEPLTKWYERKETTESKYSGSAKYLAFSGSNKPDVIATNILKQLTLN